jgi:hypothetical protein
VRILFLAVALALLAGCCASADDIVTMPTANQLKMGEVDVAAYYLDLDFPKPAPQFVQYQTLYVGLTDRVELDVHRAAIDNNETSTLLVGSFKLMSETMATPDVVVGCRNITGTATTFDNPFTPINERAKSEKQSFFVSAAKTFFMKPLEPGPPLVRAHLSIGTEDWTLLGEKRHQGIFGGLQFLFTPNIGAVVQNDGQDLITGITIMPTNSGLTIKGGTYGDHTWVGIAWRKNFFSL